MHDSELEEIHARVIRAGTTRLSQLGRDRRALLNEVYSLRAKVAALESDCHGDYSATIDQLEETVVRLGREVDAEKRVARGFKEQRDTYVKRYNELSASVSRVVNNSMKLYPSDGIVLQAAMAHHVQQVEHDCAERIQASTEAVETANREAEKVLRIAEQEKAIRRRVHERFKRMRREVILAAETINGLKLDLERQKRRASEEASLGYAARKFAALAYRALESEDLEDRGQEPTWP